jgi:D-inositol-3-phosphate glycosyltransferase
MYNNHLNIAILSVHSSPLGQPGIGDTGGMSIYIRELTAELTEQGHHVDIYTRSQDPTLPEVIELSPGARQIHIHAGDPVDLDKLVIYAHAPDVACKTEGFRKAHDLHYDIIFSHYWISGISGLYLQAWWQIPHVVMFHTLGAVKNNIGIGEDEPELRIQEETLIARECDRIIASTENEKYLLKEHYNVPSEKVSVVSCGVNTRLFRPLDKYQSKKALGLGSEKIILFVGRIERLKGIDRLIQSMSDLQDIKPKLLIVGEDGNRQGETEKLKVLVGKLGINDRVNFRGLAKYEKLPLYYNAADVCVLPSYYESFGLVPLESLACGTPVVSTDVGNLRNIIRQGETGYVLPDNRPERLAEKIRLILSGNTLRWEDQLKIRASVTSLSWAKIARLVTHELERLTVRDKVKT